ncbi:trypsin-7-like [Tribolium madens]|uniref:trypsin-7-like n=1 Tax=Tribolium madens TaxID=41895 RepID=UPI001CF7600A|nr:trypsin-7-like [Tribolium madens]
MTSFLFAVFLTTIFSVSSVFSQNRIIGGDDIDVSEVPWQVQLEFDNFGQFCGGSIIGEKYIITAAHCTKIWIGIEKFMFVRAGTNITESGGQRVFVEQMFIHPDYNEKNFDYDFAILELQDSLEFGDEVSPVSLPSSDTEWEPGTSAFVSGFGVIDVEKGTDSPVLKGVTVKITDKEECKKRYKNFYTDRKICAGFSEGGKDSCQGDSGGPLVVGDVLAGVVSGGDGCGKKNTPGLYINVALLRDYIKEKTGI